MSKGGQVFGATTADPPEVHSFGGEGSVVHIAHANGFPPGTYRRLAETFTGRYRVLALSARPLWPNSLPEDAPTWHTLANDLIQGLDALGVADGVGIGHSLGGVLTMWAAIQRPDLFRTVILVEPVILPPRWLWYLRVLRRLGLEKRLPVVQGAKRRRRTWPSRQACYEQYRRKAFFAQWPDDVLNDYVTSATRSSDGGSVELVYPTEWEAHIFATTPTGIWRDVQRLRTPALVIRGEHSTVFRADALARMRGTLPAARFVTMTGVGHLAPMEKAGEMGAIIRRFLAALDAGEAAH